VSAPVPSDTFGIAAISHRVPPISKTVRELHADGMLLSEPAALEELGFRHCRIWDRPANEVAALCVKDALDAAGVAPDEVDLLINASAIAASTTVPGPAVDAFGADTSHLRQFMYSTARIQDELDLVSARTMGISELSCSSLLGGVWMARSIMKADELDVAVVVNADVFPENAKREVVYNVISDSSCAVVLRRGEIRRQLLAYNQMTKGYYWDCDKRQNELIASYFTTGKRVVQNTLKRAGVSMSDVKMIVPHNVSLRSWDILSRHIGYPLEQIYTGNIAESAHSIAADNFINLRAVVDQGLVKPGDLVMLYCFGLGAHWACSLMTI
jgi:3-oxoacyl-[acyl-carrier-protein] synthase III